MPRRYAGLIQLNTCPLLGARPPASSFSIPFDAYEASALQPLVQHDEPIGIPIQSFDTVIAAATKQKQCITESIQLKLLLHNPGQTIYSFNLRIKRIIAAPLVSF